MTAAEQFDKAQARLKAEKPPGTLLGALLSVQKELPSISLQKTGKNPAFKSKYLTLDGLHAAILPLLNRHGLIWTTRPGYREGQPILSYELIHANAQGPEDRMSGTMPLMLDKQNSQGLGSAITYARRYSLLSVIGAVGDEDDDGNAASRKPPAPSEQPTKARENTDRLLTDDEKAAVLKAMSGHRDKDMLLRSVGCDDLDSLTVGMAWELRRKLGPEASAK